MFVYIKYTIFVIIVTQKLLPQQFKYAETTSSAVHIRRNYFLSSPNTQKPLPQQSKYAETIFSAVQIRRNYLLSSPNTHKLSSQPSK